MNHASAPAGYSGTRFPTTPQIIFAQLARRLAPQRAECGRPERGHMIVRIILIALLQAVMGSAQAAEEHLATLRVGSEVYSNVTVTSVSVTDIFFTHSRGVGNAKLKNLDPAVQKMFHFDPAKSDAQQAEQAKANALYTQAVRNSPPPKRPPEPEPEPEPQQPVTANGVREDRKSVV